MRVLVRKPLANKIMFTCELYTGLIGILISELSNSSILTHTCFFLLI